MRVKYHVSEVIVVEGRYDKNTLSQILDATVIETGGFGIFRDAERLAMLRALAERRGLVILTDSDGAGFLIRNRLKSAIDPKYLKHAYIPDVPGREKRKRAKSREGMLGVEGMTPEIIVETLRRAGVRLSESDAAPERSGITKAELYALGLSGAPDSASRRDALKRELGLPQKLSSSALLEVLDVLFTPEELRKKLEK